MALDTERPLSPGWWLVRLTRRLNAQRARTQYLERLYKGDHDLPSVPAKYRTVFRMFQAQARTNYLSLVVEAPLERMNVEGFRVGDSMSTDAATWDRWQGANMDADQVVVHRSMLALGRGYTLVAPHPRKADTIAITPEFPDQVIVEPYPEDRREVRMALKMWEDDISGDLRANLFATAGELDTKGYLLKFKGPRSTRKELLLSQDVVNLLPILGEWDLVDSSPTGMDDNPMTAFENRPGVDFRPRAEFEDVIDIQNRINVTLFHRLVAEAFGSFRQRAILNYVYDEDADGNAIPPDLQVDPASSWIFERGEDPADRGVSLFEFSQTDTSNIISAAEADVRDLAAITRTPPHYLLTGMNNIGGDALKTAETGLVSKVKREHIPQASGSWQATMRKAAELAGDNPDELLDAEVLWADAESRTMAELYDAAVKAQTAGVPWRQRMELLGYTPKEIDRMEAQRTADAMLASMSAPLIPTTPGISTPGQPPATPGAPQGAQASSGGSNINSAENGAGGV